MSERIDHAAKAVERLTWVTDSLAAAEGSNVTIPEHEALYRGLDLSAQRAQAHATLALAEQLRVRNILDVEQLRMGRRALHGSYPGPSPVFLDPAGTDQTIDYLVPALAEALGINEGAGE